MRFLFVLIILFFVSCFPHDEDFNLVNNYDKTVSLVSDSKGNIYFQSKTNEQCGTEYWYSETANLDDGKDDINMENITKPLNKIIDLDSFKLKHIENNLYYFEDKNNTYLLFLTMCDSSISYMSK